MSEKNDELIAQAEVGEAAKQFMQGELGKIMLGLADQERELAQLEMEEINPDDPKAIRAVQARIWRAKSFREWLEGLVSDGDQAMRVWQQQEQES